MPAKGTVSKAEPALATPPLPAYFGQRWPPGTTELQAALAMFLSPELSGSLGKADFFWVIVGILWGERAPKHFVRHPWAEKMADEACKEKYLAVSGCGSSGKTDFFAVWALVNWLAAPLDTKILVTSTSLKESRKRIWGSVREYYLHASVALPGKLLDSIGQIRCDSGTGSQLASDKAGIELVAGEKSKEKEAVGKLIGIKRSRVFLIADELPELPESILEAAYGNLSLNPSFQLIGIGNFKSTLDAFGIFSAPAAGWKAVTVESEEWQTRRGKCIRLDGMKSPNILLGEDVWPIYGSRQLAEHMKEGENTAQFWRMCRSFPAPEGMAEYIYCEAELIAGDVFESAKWQGNRIRLAALDPAFTNGGDRPMLVFGWLGTETSGRRILAYDRFVRLQEDVRITDVPFDFQIARAFQRECLAEGVHPDNAAFDATGAGISFGSIVAHEWSPRVLPVQFGGAASERMVSPTDPRTGKEAYVNRVSELWYQGREFVRAGQIRGVSTELAKELTSRKYETRKDGGTRIVVEPKKEMKQRLGYSPDLADASMVLLELARDRHGFNPVGFGTGLKEREDFLRNNPTDLVFREEAFLQDEAA